MHHSLQCYNSYKKDDKWQCNEIQSMRYTVLLFIMAPFYVLLVFVGICSVFWLFWLSYYLPSDWLERLLWGSLTVVRGSSPENQGWRVRVIFLVYCIASLFYYVFVLSPAPTWHIFLLLWRIFVLKVPLNPSKQTNDSDSDKWCC